MREWIDALNALPLAGLMLVVTFGYSLGRVTWREISLGPGAATLLIALAFGSLGLTSGSVAALGESRVGLGAFGFALFIYSVGFDAAPHLLSLLRERRGLSFVAVAFVVNGLALGLTFVAAWAVGMGASDAAGLLAGLLTSAPTYAAASEIAPNATALAVAFAITYPVGLFGVVLMIQIIPRLRGVDLADEAARDGGTEQLGPTSDHRPSGPSSEVTRAFEVRVPDVVGQSLRDLDLTRRTGCVISRIDQAGSLVIPGGETILEHGDHLMVTGRVDELMAFGALIGPEVSTDLFRSRDLPTRRIHVRHTAVTGHSLADLRILNRFHCVITRIERGSLWIEPDADVALVRDDILEVVGERPDLRALARELGHFERPASETDLTVYAGGIVLGILIGSARIEVFGVELGVGYATGLLGMGLLLGALQRLGPLRTHVPREARQLVRDLGILLFVGETGLAAGAALWTELHGVPWTLLGAALAINGVTVLVALFIARRVLGLRRVDAWGSICGALTSAAALQAVRRATDGNEAAISYAAAYAVASVLATLAGPVLVMLLGG